MSKRKTLTAICAAALVCAMSVAGTLAYLTAKQDDTKAVKNTFTAVEGLIDPDGPASPDPKVPDNKDLDNGFYLVETAVKLENGVYKLDETASKYVLENTYDKVVPNMEIPKDPKLTVDLNDGVSAYVFVKVEDKTGGKLTYTMDSKWTEVTGVSSLDGAKLYVYNNAPVAGTADTEVEGVSILNGDKVTAVADLTGGFEGGSNTLTFSAYVCQSASFADAKTAFETCFPAE